MTYQLPFDGHREPQPSPYHETSSWLKYCLDFAMPIGTPVLAIADGEVIMVRKGYCKNYTTPKHADRTNIVQIKHKNGNVSLYGHLKSVMVKKGQIVVAGTQIGESGDVGYATYPHLHFGLYNDEGNNIIYESDYVIFPVRRDKTIKTIY